MRTAKLSLISYGILLPLLAFMETAHATVITAGEISVTRPWSGGGTFSFSVSDKSVTGSYDEGTPWRSSGYYEGESFSGNQSLTGGVIDFFHGYVDSQFMIWHQTLSPIRSSLRTTAAGGQFIQGQTIYQSTFDFQGTLCGAVMYNAPQCDVVFDLTGQGIAQFSFAESVLDDGRHIFTATNARYTFTAVPEPEMLALYCGALAAVLLARRRRDSGNANSAPGLINSV